MHQKSDLEVARQRYIDGRHLAWPSPTYSLTDTYDLSVRRLVASHKGGITKNTVPIRVEAEDFSDRSFSPSVVIDFVVASLRPIASPNEQSSTEQEVKYHEPDWVGEAWVVERDPVGGNYRVITQMQFVFDVTSDSNKITEGQIKFKTPPC